MQSGHTKLPSYWGGWPLLLEDIQAEMASKAPAATPVKHRQIVTEAMSKAFWAPARKPVIMIKAKPGPTRAEVKRAGQAKLAGYVAEADRLARSGKLTGVEGAHVDAQIARLAMAVASL